MHVQMPSACCTANGISRSVIKSARSENEAVTLLLRSLQHAQRDLLANQPDTARVNEVLADLAAELAPGFPHLYAVADAQPFGPVAAVLAHLRVAFAHAASGRSAPAVTSVVTAATNAFRLTGDAALSARNTEASDRARYR